MANLDVTQLSAFIFDLDGVIWRGDKAIDGAVEAIKRLQDAGKHCVYCTNNASSTPADYVTKLASMGVVATEDDVMTSAWATALYLSSQLTGQFSAYVVGEEGLVSMLRKTGARVVTMQGMNPITNDIIEDTAFPVDCVVAGIDRSFTFDKLRLAQRFILNGAQFIATNRDATFPVDGGVVPGAGAIVSAIETASGVTPLTIGKPQALMPMLLMQRFDFKPETTAFVGDRLNTDIVSAHRANLPGIFVATGISTREEAERAKGLQKPDAIFADLSELAHEVLKDRPVAGGTDNLPTMDEALVSTTATEVAPVAPLVTTSAAPSAASLESAPDGLDATFASAGSSQIDPAGTGAPAANNLSDFSFDALDAEPAAASTPPVAAPPVAAPPVAPATPPLVTFDEDEPQSGIEVEPASSPFGFTLEDEAGTAVAPRPASGAANSGSTPTPAPTPTPNSSTARSAQPVTQTVAPQVVAPQSPAQAKPSGGAAQAAPETANIQPGLNNKDIDVGEPLDNWWESIEDAFKKS